MKWFAYKNLMSVLIVAVSFSIIIVYIQNYTAKRALAKLLSYFSSFIWIMWHQLFIFFFILFPNFTTYVAAGINTIESTVWSNCWAAHSCGIIPSSKPYDEQHTCNRSDNTGGTAVRDIDKRGVHSPWHLSKCSSSTLGVSCAWHVELRCNKEAVAHKLSSLLCGYFCHMLVFTAFLLLSNNFTHSIYPTACRQTDQCLFLYVIKF